MTRTARTLLNRLIGKVRLRHAQLMVLTADLGSTHKAAEEAGLSQPSVAKFLADLERLVDMPLFERHARGMRPTPAGLALLPVMRNMLALAQSGAQSLTALREGAAGAVHVGALPAACHGAIMSALAHFAEAHPKVHLHLHEAPMADLRNELAIGALDIALIRQPSLVPQGHRFDPLVEDWPVVVARAGHRLSHQREIDVMTLAREQWLTFPDSMTSRMIFDGWFQETPSPPAVLNVTTSSLAAVIALVAESDALIVLPNSLAAPAIATGQVCSLSIRQPDRIPPLGILWRGDSASAAAQALCHWLCEKLPSAGLPR